MVYTAGFEVIIQSYNNIFNIIEISEDKEILDFQYLHWNRDLPDILHKNSYNSMKRMQATQ